MAKTPTGFPGKKAIGIGGTPLERVLHEAELASRNAVAAHEAETDPHPDYLTLDEVPLVTFAQHFKWGLD